MLAVCRKHSQEGQGLPILWVVADYELVPVRSRAQHIRDRMRRPMFSRPSALLHVVDCGCLCALLHRDVEGGLEGGVVSGDISADLSHLCTYKGDAD